MTNLAIDEMLGTPPRDPRICQAASAGDPWLLGHSKEPNEMLAHLLGLTIRPRDDEDSPFLVMPAKAPKLGMTSPDVVMGATQADLSKMIAEAVAMALAVRDEKDAAKKAKQSAGMAKAKAARKPRTPAVAVATV